MQILGHSYVKTTVHVYCISNNSLLPLIQTILFCSLISFCVGHDLSTTFSDLRKTILKTKSKADPDIQHAAVEDLIKRLFEPLDVSRFLVEVQPQGLGDPAYDAARVRSNSH